MRNDYATIGGCASSGAPGNAEMNRKMQALSSQSAAQNTCLKPTAPEQPLLGEALDRLRRIRDGLVDGNGRIETVTDRVLGPVPVNPSVGSTPSGITVADELLDLIRGIALQVERLHEAASRVERIG